MIISIITISVTKQTPSTDYLAPSIIVSCRLATAVSKSVVGKRINDVVSVSLRRKTTDMITATLQLLFRSY